MNKNKNPGWLPIILIFIGLVLVGGAIGWVSFTAYQNYRLNQQQSTAKPGAQTALRIPYPDIPRVSLKGAKAAYEIGNAKFLDVRGEQYYQQAHIPGALSIPEDQLPQRLTELQKSEWIILYCT